MTRSEKDGPGVTPGEEDEKVAKYSSCCAGKLRRLCLLSCLVLRQRHSERGYQFTLHARLRLCAPCPSQGRRYTPPATSTKYQ
jgi:hypothetical protein